MMSARRVAVAVACGSLVVAACDRFAGVSDAPPSVGDAGLWVDGAVGTPAQAHVFVVGGLDESSPSLATGYTARVENDGSLGGWLEIPPMPEGRYRGALAATDDGLVFVGGAGPSAVPRDRALIARLDRGVITNWTESTSDSALTRWRNGAVAHQGKVLAIGGWLPSDETNATATSGKTPAEGLGQWTANTPLPAPAAQFTASLVGDNVYVVVEASPDAGRAGWVGGIGPTGAINAWRDLPPLPSGRAATEAASAASATHVYASGGYTNGPSDWVSVARIREDGTLDSWMDTSRMKIGRTAHTMVVAKNRVYIFGGTDDSGGLLDSVEVATIRADGTLEAFTAARPLPKRRAFHSSALVTSR